MSISVSERGLRAAFAAGAAVMLAAAAAFYVGQNAGWWVGGPIALPKVLWLGYAIFFWFYVPALIAIDARTGDRLRRVYLVFLALMWLRAVVELWMLYVTHNWHPYLGIAHDLVCLAWVILGLRRARPLTADERMPWRLLIVVAGMLAVEIAFAWYFWLNLARASAELIYYVPEGGAHAAMLALTWSAVAALSVYLWYFARRWWYGKAAW